MEKETKYIITGIAAALAVVLLIFSTVIVKAGHTGVVITMGKVQENVLHEGFHFKRPLIDRVVQIDNRIVKLEVDTEAFSKDLQTVEAKLAVNYRVDSSKSQDLYKNVGKKYEDTLITPAMNEVLKIICSGYTAEETIASRSQISTSLTSGLNDKLTAHGITVTDVNIIDFDFSDAFINAIEDKQVAQQKLLKAETDKQTAITNAEAEAETLKIKANAEAEANRILSESLTDKIIRYTMIEKWDGVLPKYSGSGTPIIDLAE